MLKLTGRYYRTIPIDNPGFETETIELDPARTAFIGMHCWNIGCPDGPAINNNYWVGMGFPQTSHEAERIMRECIRPAMDAARRAGVTVCHVESAKIGEQHPAAQEDLDEPPAASSTASPPVLTDWMTRMTARFHGADYPTQSPYARMDRAQIVTPLPGEPYVYQTGQLDRILRRRGIENLIYSGFATDMCVLRAPGGVEPMLGSGYRMFLMRDATIGVEMPDTFEERIATRWAIRYFETHFGDTISTDDFIQACEACRSN
jgi:nicotinamidase-related amidase